MPQVRGFLSPQRRQRMFDTMFPDRPGYHIGAPQPPRFERDTRSGLMRLELETGEEMTPEDVEVKVHGRDVSFHAKHEKRSNDGRDYSFRSVELTRLHFVLRFRSSPAPWQFRFCSIVASLSAFTMPPETDMSSNGSVIIFSAPALSVVPAHRGPNERNRKKISEVPSCRTRLSIM